MFKISIPKPCFEGWENMLPNERGRHCNSCAKTVVDFTVMSDEAVQQYFISNAGQKICGHFKNSQIERIVIDLPQNIFRIYLPFWKKFLVAFLICFGSSFLSIDTTLAGTSFIQGEPINTVKKTTEVKNTDHQKKRKKKKHSDKFIYTLRDISPTMGLVYTCPVQPVDNTLSGFTVVKETNCPDYDTSPLVHTNPGTDIDLTIKYNAGSTSSKKSPIPHSPLPDTAFILPTVLAARNPFSKKKKA